MNRERLRRSQPETNRTWFWFVEPHVSKALCNGLGKKYHLVCREIPSSEAQIPTSDGRVVVEVNLQNDRLNTDLYTDMARLRTGKNPLELKPNF